MKVYTLRKNGFKVKVSHYRRYTTHDSKTGKPISFLQYYRNADDRVEAEVLVNSERYFLNHYGGKTTVTLSKDGFTAYGTAYCNDNDRYVKVVGVSKALEGALKIWKDHKASGKSTIIAD